MSQQYSRFTAIKLYKIKIPRCIGGFFWKQYRNSFNGGNCFFWFFSDNWISRVLLINNDVKLQRNFYTLIKIKFLEYPNETETKIRHDSNLNLFD